MRFEQLFSLEWKMLAAQTATMSKADVQQLSSLLDHLLIDIICQQLLPDAVKHVSRTFGVSFSFKPHEYVGCNCCCDIDISCSHPTLSSISMTHDSPGSSPSALSWTVNPVAFEHLPSDEHRGCELQLSLLHNIFSSVETDAYRSWHVRVYYDALKSGCPLVVFNDVPVKTDFYFRLQPFDCMADLLASLLTDGYDLTSLQSFLRT